MGGICAGGLAAGTANGKPAGSAEGAGEVRAREGQKRGGNGRQRQ